MNTIRNINTIFFRLIYDRFFLLEVLESVGDLGEITAIETIADRVEATVEVSAVVAAQVAAVVGDAAGVCAARRHAIPAVEAVGVARETLYAYS